MDSFTPKTLPLSVQLPETNKQGNSHNIDSLDIARIRHTSSSTSDNLFSNMNISSDSVLLNGSAEQHINSNTAQEQSASFQHETSGSEGEDQRKCLPDPLKIPEIKEMLEGAPEYCKISVTLGRLPKAEEIGKKLITYVDDGKGGVKKETENEITKNHIIARNPTRISSTVFFNDWLVPKDEWGKKYNQVPENSDTFREYKRSGNIKCIKIDDHILKLLSAEDPNFATISVSWSKEGMKVFKGGYLSDLGYGISAIDMNNTYKLAE